MSKKLKNMLVRIIVSAILFVLALVLPVSQYIKIALFVVSYVIIGYKIVTKVFRNFSSAQIFDENFLMTIATFGAFYLGEYSEAVAVMLFFQVGEFFEHYAVDKSRKSITDLMNIRPDYANVIRNGKVEKVDPEEVSINDVIIVQPGEKVPLDGVITEGSTSLNTSALTGESMPSDVYIGDNVISGCINLTGVISVKVTRKYEDSTVAKILDLVENASTKKANVENFITKFARYYTPTVVGLAVLIGVLSPFVFGDGFHGAAYKAITFLVISCPCALVISIPLSFFGGLGSASRNGILVKGSNYLEALANGEIVVFDKTGTITKGNFRVIEINPSLVTAEKLLEVAAYAEFYSKHPIADSIKSEYGKEIDFNRIQEIKEVHGFGIEAVINGERVNVGNDKMMEKIKIKMDKTTSKGTIVYVAINDEFVGSLVIADEVKEDSAIAIKLLRSMGIKNIEMLTGDRKEIAEEIAKSVGIEYVHSELLPTDKVDIIEKLMENKSSKGKLVFVGDGINDAPVLARVDVGIAMGGIGSDAAIEAADVVIMNDKLTKIATAIKIAKKTLLIARENIVFAIGVKVLVLLLSTFGYASIWAAVFADVGVSFIAILNSVRILGYKDKN